MWLDTFACFATPLQRPLRKSCTPSLICNSEITRCWGLGRSRVCHLVERENCARTPLQYSTMLLSPVLSSWSGGVWGLVGYVPIASILLHCCVGNSGWLRRGAARGVANSGAFVERTLVLSPQCGPQWYTIRLSMIYTCVTFTSREKSSAGSQ